MSDPTPDVDATREPGEAADAAWLAMVLGLLASIVLAGTGLVMALDRVDCDPGSTDDLCGTHPQAELGIAFIAIAVALGAIVVLGKAVHDAVRDRVGSA